MSDEFSTADFIERALVNAGIFYRKKRNDFAISCPYHNHSGKQQKLEITKETGVFHCWACD